MGSWDRWKGRNSVKGECAQGKRGGCTGARLLCVLCLYFRTGLTVGGGVKQKGMSRNLTHYGKDRQVMDARKY